MQEVEIYVLSDTPAVTDAQPPMADGALEPLHRFASEVHLTPNQFAARFGDAFLLVTGATPAATGPFTVLQPETPVLTGEMMVATLRKTARNPTPFITVGRTPNNDVVLTERSVSKLHAYFLLKDGVYKLLDAGSRHGTFIDGHPVPARGDGGALVVKPQQTLMFGTYLTTFATAAAVHSLAKRMLAFAS